MPMRVYPAHMAFMSFATASQLSPPQKIPCVLCRGFFADLKYTIAILNDLWEVSGKLSLVNEELVSNPLNKIGKLLKYKHGEQ